MFKMKIKEAYQTLDRIEKTLKELRDGETQLERTMLRIRIAQSELGKGSGLTLGLGLGLG